MEILKTPEEIQELKRQAYEAEARENADKHRQLARLEQHGNRKQRRARAAEARRNA